MLLGQKYLALETGKDRFLQMISKKYNSQSLEESYKSLLDWGITEDDATVFSWMYKLSKSIPTPEWISSIAKIPWSSVYTSSYATILTRAFESDWRSVQPITDERYRVSDPRDKINLHITYLFGAVGEVDVNLRPPLKRGEYLKSNRMLSRSFGVSPFKV